MDTRGRRLDRRSFVFGGLGVLSLAVVPPGVVRLLGDRSRSTNAVTADRLVELFADPEEVAPLGRRYLELRRDRPDESRLISELLPPHADPASIIRASDAELRELLDAWMADDLAAGRIEEVDGWLLSSTDVRLAALLAMRS